MTDDGTGIVSHVGTLVVLPLADRVRLTEALSKAVAPTRSRAGGHVLRRLPVFLADGGDCISDLRVLREQVDLFGPAASTASGWRVLDSIDDDGLDRLRAARPRTRAHAWAASTAPAQRRCWTSTRRWRQ